MKNPDRAPLVSVIIPVYNGSNYLREAIDSVLSQTFDDYELIVVDDGSIDDTPAIAASYGACLTYIRQANGGVAAALNHGILYAHGKYVAWLSHDDVFLPSKLACQVNFLQQFPKFKACYTDFYIIDIEGTLIREVETSWYPREQAIRALFGWMYINGSSMLIERSCFDSVGLFSEQFRYAQDAEMWFRMLQHFEVGRVPAKLLQWRYHPAQGSHNEAEARADEQTMYRQVFEQLGIARIFPERAASANDPQTRAWAYMWLGDTMAIRRQWYAFADARYREAVMIWPSWRNPARLKLAIGAWRMFGLGPRYYFALRRRYDIVRHVLTAGLRAARLTWKRRCRPTAYADRL